jgi:hypothetical protein
MAWDSTCRDAGLLALERRFRPARERYFFFDVLFELDLRLAEDFFPDVLRDDFFDEDFRDELLDDFFEVERPDDFFEDDFFAEDRFGAGGTFPPSLRASDKPMAIA